MRRAMPRHDGRHRQRPAARCIAVAHECWLRAYSVKTTQKCTPSRPSCRNSGTSSAICPAWPITPASTAASLQRRWSALLCSVLLARRLIDGAPSHRLGALVEYLGLELPDGHRAHRALGDALMTAQLWLRLLTTVRVALGADPDYAVLERLMRVPRAQVTGWLAAQAEKQVSRPWSSVD